MKSDGIGSNENDMPNYKTSVDEFSKTLKQSGYVAEDHLTLTMALALELGRPLLLEGETGVGKTEVAISLSKALQCRLIRLQCYEGLDVNAAVYEWNYQRQLMAIRVVEAASNVTAPNLTEEQIFGRAYLLERPLLQAIVQTLPPVLLIDEIDRADEEFEAYLLEVLSDFQITIPELGTIEAVTKPIVILTSNGTRELSDALRRRCLYYYVEYPSFEKEMMILRSKMPDMNQKLTRQVVSFVQSLRKEDLQKPPGVAETLDWANALLWLNVSSLDAYADALPDSMACLLKTREDRESVSPAKIERMITAAL